MPTIELKLIQAKDDEPPFSEKYQAELGRFRAQFPKDVDVQQTCFVMDSVLGGGGPLGHFVFSLTEGLIPVITGAVGYWLKTRIDRKLRLKIGDIEVEATNEKDFKMILEKALVVNEQQHHKEKIK